MSSLVPPFTTTDFGPNLFHSGDFSDITIVSRDGAEFPAHKVILSARSSVFQRMLNHDMSESLTGRIRIDDVSFDAIMALMSFIYTGNIEKSRRFIDNNVVQEIMEGVLQGDYEQEQKVEIGVLFEVFPLSDKYDIPGLQTFIATALKQRLAQDNVCQVLQFVLAITEAAPTPRCYTCMIQLMEACLLMIRNNIENVMATEGWNLIAADYVVMSALMSYCDLAEGVMSDENWPKFCSNPMVMKSLMFFAKESEKAKIMKPMPDSESIDIWSSAFAVQRERSSWKCEVCGIFNIMHLASCAACEARRR